MMLMITIRLIIEPMVFTIILIIKTRLDKNDNKLLIYSQTYAADIFFGQSWEDHRLKLPANMTG